MARTRIVTIFGGSGFVGRYIAQRMAKAGWRVRVAVRRPNEALFVKTYGVVGQVEPILANIRDDRSTRAAIAGADAVVNCVGILNKTMHQDFPDVQVHGAARIARLSAELGVSHMVHLSAIGADPESESEYARTKAAGETEILAAFPSATILRCSIIFGAEDQFFNRFARMARMALVIPLVRGDTLFQPVFVDDVAAAAHAAIDRRAPGIYELGGPQVASFRDLILTMLEIIRRKRIVINMPVILARITATLMDFGQFASLNLIENKVLTRDQVRQLGKHNVVTPGMPGLEDLGVTPTSMDVVLEGYLYCYRRYGQYTALTESARELRG